MKCRLLNSVFWGFLLSCLLGSNPVVAAEPLWLISTREAPVNSCCQGTVGPEAFDYHYCNNDGQWTDADLPAFLATNDPAVPTTIFVHGNRTDRQSAAEMGCQIYRRLQCAAEGRPFRLVIWSWPSERMSCGARADARIKACRSDAESFYLANVLDRLPSPSPVALIGYSFGARVVSGALELLAGGTIACQTLDSKRDHTLRPRVLLIAAAADSDWLAAGHRYGQALSQVESMLISCNQRDPALRRYRFMESLCHGPTALGFTGALGLSEQDRSKVALLDVGREVGRHHDWDRYFSSPSILARLSDYAMKPKDRNTVRHEN